MSDEKVIPGSCRCNWGDAGSAIDKKGENVSVGPQDHVRYELTSPGRLSCARIEGGLLAVMVEAISGIICEFKAVQRFAQRTVSTIRVTITVLRYYNPRYAVTIELGALGCR